MTTKKLSPAKNLYIAQFFAIDDMHIMCTKPPRCILFQQSRNRGTHFNSLEDGTIPIFPTERSITIKSYSIRRKQVPLCTAFAVTDYKSQGQTFSDAILDLETNHKKGQDSHRKFCSFYVQLGRLTSSKGLHLLKKIDISDITNKPHPDLVAETKRLQDLETQTLARWHTEID